MIYLYADKCTTCSGNTRQDVLAIQRYCYEKKIGFSKINTRYSRESRQEAVDRSATLKNPLQSATGSYTPFIYTDTKNTAVLLKDITNDILSDLV